MFLKIFSLFLKSFVYIYKSLLAVHMGGACRFTPSCSDYALEAINNHSPMFAAKLISKRVCSCRPGGPFGYDPVPSRGSNE